MKSKEFIFDWVADESVSQQEFFNNVANPVINSFFQGKTSTIYTYGQSGSGKSYTMYGPIESIYFDKENQKYEIFAASAKALKMCNWYRDLFLSYFELHKLTNRATPLMYCNFKCDILLYRTFNATGVESEWIQINLNVISTPRQENFIINRLLFNEK